MSRLLTNVNRRRALQARLAVEQLEGRWVPSTLTVTNNLDGGAGSLRADIAAAHSGDTVAFAAGLDGQTITLTKGELRSSPDASLPDPLLGQPTPAHRSADHHVRPR